MRGTVWRSRSAAPNPGATGGKWRSSGHAVAFRSATRSYITADRYYLETARSGPGVGSGRSRGRIVRHPRGGEDVRRPERRQSILGVVPHRKREACKDSRSSDRGIRRDAGSWRNDPSPATRPIEVAEGPRGDVVGNAPALAQRSETVQYVRAPRARRDPR